MRFTYIDNSCTSKTRQQLHFLLSEHFNYLKTPKSDTHIQQSIELALQAKGPAHFIGILEDGNQLVGFCFFNIGIGISSGGKYVWLNDIHIKETHRGKGYGSSLLEFVLDWVKKEGCVYIACIAGNWNQHSQNLFKKMGFELSIDDIWMDKLL